MKSIAVVALCMFAAAAGEAEADASASPLPLSPCACSPPLLARLKHLLMLAISMVTMDMGMPLAMPTMDTMDTHMPTMDMDTTMARGPLMPSPPLPLSPRLMLMLSTDTMDTLLPMPTT